MSSPDGIDDGEHIGVGLVKISKIRSAEHIADIKRQWDKPVSNHYKNKEHAGPAPNAIFWNISMVTRNSARSGSINKKRIGYIISDIMPL